MTGEATQQAQSLYSGLPNGHAPPKKQKKSKKDDELPSYESMMDGAGVSGMTNASEQQPSSSNLDTCSAGAQEAALHLLQSLLQVTASCSLPMGCFVAAQVFYPCFESVFLSI